VHGVSCRVVPSKPSVWESTARDRHTLMARRWRLGSEDAEAPIATARRCHGRSLGRAAAWDGREIQQDGGDHEGLMIYFERGNIRFNYRVPRLAPSDIPAQRVPHPARTCQPSLPIWGETHRPRKLVSARAEKEAETCSHQMAER